MKAKRILVLIPSLALVRQTLHEWIKETAWERPRFIAVCSDPTVVRGVEDALVVHQRDLDFPVTTDISEVRDPSAYCGPRATRLTKLPHCSRIYWAQGKTR
jgi:predicted helicase